MRFVAYLSSALLAFTGTHKVEAFTQPKLSALMAEHQSTIDQLKQSSGLDDDLTLLRYCVEYNADTSVIREKIKANIQWREENKALCESAAKAVQEAMVGGTWNNNPVREAAPYANIVNKYVTPSQILTTTSNKDDLVYCIRAAKIDDKSLMSQVTVNQMAEYFIYCKEVLNLVAAKRSVATDKFIRVITANDLSGISLTGDATFRKALSASSKKATDLYPALSGPTLLLNLPPLLGALAKLFTPLFPKSVQEKLRFEQGPLKNIDNLESILSGSTRDSFLSEIDALVYK